MNKKLLMAAVGAALVAGPMLTAQAEVKVSGLAHVSIDQIKGDSTVAGTDNSNDLNVSSNSSYVQFDASEDLGGGLKAAFHLREYFRMDNTAAASTTSTSTPSTSNSNRMTDGNAFIALRGGFGDLRVGSHDSPVKVLGRSVDLFDNQIGDSRNMGVDSTRAQNVVAYFTPDLSGFQAMLVKVTNADNSNTEETSTTGNVIAATYTSPMFSVGVGRQSLDAYNTKADPETTIFTASANLDAFKVTLLWQTYTADEDTTAKVDKTTKGIGASYKMGNNTFKAQMYSISDESNASVGGAKVTNKDADILAIGLDHAMSKTFMTYVAYAKTGNDSSAAYSMAGGGHGDNPGSVTGKNMNGLSFGAKMTF